MSEKSESRQVKGAAREWTEALLIAAVLALFLRSFVIQAFKIPSGSMIPTLLIGDHIMVNKLAYHTRNPLSREILKTWGEIERGDIIVFEYPVEPDKDFVKRVIGLPGDHVAVRGKRVYVNGNLLVEDYSQFDNHDQLRIPFEEEIPAGHYFVMGDNRDQSHDSRWWGFVPIANVVGKAFFIYWSWDSESTMPRLSRLFHGFHTPVYPTAPESSESPEMMPAASTSP